MSEQTRIGDYLLGELDAAERALFEEQLRDDPAARRETEQLSALVSRLGALPSDAWERAAPLPAPAPARRGLRERWAQWSASRRTFTVLAPVAGLAVAVALLLGSGGGSGSGGPSAVLAALPGTPSAASATATMQGRDRMVLDVRYLPPSARGDYYELWLMTSQTKLVSVTRFRVPASGRARLTLRLPAPPGDYRYFDVSRQRVGGGERISNDSVLRAPIPA